jgi:signal peptidase II
MREHDHRPVARNGWASNLLLLAIAAVVLVVDQGSKHLVQQHFGPCDSAPVSLLGDWLSLIYTCNHGAAFGILANETLLFVLIALVVVGVIVAYFRFLPANRPWLKVSLGLQLGGALGNLIDRVHQGFVVDFIWVKAWPVFNVADSCIVIGVLILAYYLLIMPGKPVVTPAPQPTTPAAPLGEGQRGES